MYDSQATKQTTISVDEFKKCCKVIENSGLPVTTMRDLNNPPNNPPQTWEITVFRDGIPIFNEVTSDSTRLKELIDIYKDQDEIVIQRLG